MGINVKPKLVIGVLASEVIKHKQINVEFEKYDERGHKTGEVGVDVKHELRVSIGDDNKVMTESKIYSDLVSDILEIEESPYKLNTMGTFNLNEIKDEYGIDDFVVGMAVIEFDAMYDATFGNIPFNELHTAVNKVNQYIENKYGTNSLAKIYLLGGVSA